MHGYEYVYFIRGGTFYLQLNVCRTFIKVRNFSHVVHVICRNLHQNSIKEHRIRE